MRLPLHSHKGLVPPYNYPENRMFPKGGETMAFVPVAMALLTIGLLAHQAYVFGVNTVVVSQGVARTVDEPALSSSTVHFIQPYLSCPVFKASQQELSI